MIPRLSRQFLLVLFLFAVLPARAAHADTGPKPSLYFPAYRYNSAHV